MNSLVEAGVYLSGAGDLVGVVCDWSRDSLGGDVWGTVFYGVLCAEIVEAVKGFMSMAYRQGDALSSKCNSR